MTESPKQSDQLPEEGPAEQVPDDVSEAGEGAARESARAHAERAGSAEEAPGYRDDEEQRAYERERADEGADDD